MSSSTTPSTTVVEKGGLTMSSSAAVVESGKRGLLEKMEKMNGFFGGWHSLLRGRNGRNKKLKREKKLASPSRLASFGREFRGRLMLEPLEERIVPAAVQVDLVPGEYFAFKEGGTGPAIGVVAFGSSDPKALLNIDYDDATFKINEITLAKSGALTTGDYQVFTNFGDTEAGGPLVFDSADAGVSTIALPAGETLAPGTPAKVTIVTGVNFGDGGGGTELEVMDPITSGKTGLIFTENSGLKGYTSPSGYFQVGAIGSDVTSLIMDVGGAGVQAFVTLKDYVAPLGSTFNAVEILPAGSDAGDLTGGVLQTKEVDGTINIGGSLGDSIYVEDGSPTFNISVGKDIVDGVIIDGNADNSSLDPAGGIGDVAAGVSGSGNIGTTGGAGVTFTIANADKESDIGDISTTDGDIHIAAIRGPVAGGISDLGKISVTDGTTGDDIYIDTITNIGGTWEGIDNADPGDDVYLPTTDFTIGTIEGDIRSGLGSKDDVILRANMTVTNDWNGDITAGLGYVKSINDGGGPYSINIQGAASRDTDPDLYRGVLGPVLTSAGVDYAILIVKDDWSPLPAKGGVATTANMTITPFWSSADADFTDPTDVQRPRYSLLSVMGVSGGTDIIAQTSADASPGIEISELAGTTSDALLDFVYFDNGTTPAVGDSGDNQHNVGNVLIEGNFGVPIGTGFGNPIFGIFDVSDYGKAPANEADVESICFEGVSVPGSTIEAESLGAVAFRTTSLPTVSKNDPNLKVVDFVNNTTLITELTLNLEEFVFTNIVSGPVRLSASNGSSTLFVTKDMDESTTIETAEVFSERMILTDTYTTDKQSVKALIDTIDPTDPGGNLSGNFDVGTVTFLSVPGIGYESQLSIGEITGTGQDAYFLGLIPVAPYVSFIEVEGSIGTIDINDSNPGNLAPASVGSISAGLNIFGDPGNILLPGIIGTDQVVTEANISTLFAPTNDAQGWGSIVEPGYPLTFNNFNANNFIIPGNIGGTVGVSSIGYIEIDGYLGWSPLSSTDTNFALVVTGSLGPDEGSNKVALKINDTVVDLLGATLGASILGSIGIGDNLIGDIAVSDTANWSGIQSSTIGVGIRKIATIDDPADFTPYVGNLGADKESYETLVASHNGIDYNSGSVGASGDKINIKTFQDSDIGNNVGDELVAVDDIFFDDTAGNGFVSEDDIYMSVISLTGNIEGNIQAIGASPGNIYGDIIAGGDIIGTIDAGSGSGGSILGDIIAGVWTGVGQMKAIVTADEDIGSHPLVGEDDIIFGATGITGSITAGAAGAAGVVGSSPEGQTATGSIYSSIDASGMVGWWTGGPGAYAADVLVHSYIAAGPDGLVQTTAAAGDVQLIAAGPTVVGAGAVAIVAGPDGIIDTTPLLGDDVLVTPPQGAASGAGGNITGDISAFLNIGDPTNQPGNAQVIVARGDITGKITAGTGATDTKAAEGGIYASNIIGMGSSITGDIVADGDINLTDSLKIGGIRAGLNIIYGANNSGIDPIEAIDAHTGIVLFTFDGPEAFGDDVGLAFGDRTADPFGDAVFFIDGGTGDNVWTLDRFTGAVLSMAPGPAGTDNITALALAGGVLYGLEDDADTVYNLDTGATVPIILPAGVTFDDSMTGSDTDTLFIEDSTGDLIHEYKTDGTFIRSFSEPIDGGFSNEMGLGFADGDLFIAQDNTGGGTPQNIVRVNVQTKGFEVVVGSFNAPPRYAALSEGDSIGQYTAPGALIPNPATITKVESLDGSIGAVTGGSGAAFSIIGNTVLRVASDVDNSNANDTTVNVSIDATLGDGGTIGGGPTDVDPNHGVFSGNDIGDQEQVINFLADDGISRMIAGLGGWFLGNDDDIRLDNVLVGPPYPGGVINANVDNGLEEASTIPMPSSATTVGGIKLISAPDEVRATAILTDGSFIVAPGATGGSLSVTNTYQLPRLFVAGPTNGYNFNIGVDLGSTGADIDQIIAGAGATAEDSNFIVVDVIDADGNINKISAEYVIYGQTNEPLSNIRIEGQDVDLVDAGGAVKTASNFLQGSVTFLRGVTDSPAVITITSGNVDYILAAVDNGLFTDPTATSAAVFTGTFEFGGAFALATPNIAYAPGAFDPVLTRGTTSDTDIGVFTRVAGTGGILGTDVAQFVNIAGFANDGDGVIPIATAGPGSKVDADGPGPLTVINSSLPGPSFGGDEEANVGDFILEGTLGDTDGKGTTRGFGLVGDALPTAYPSHTFLFDYEQADPGDPNYPGNELPAAALIDDKGTIGSITAEGGLVTPGAGQVKGHIEAESLGAFAVITTEKDFDDGKTAMTPLMLGSLVDFDLAVVTPTERSDPRGNPLILSTMGADLTATTDGNGLPDGAISWFYNEAGTTTPFTGVIIVTDGDDADSAPAMAYIYDGPDLDLFSINGNAVAGSLVDQVTLIGAGVEVAGAVNDILVAPGYDLEFAEVEGFLQSVSTSDSGGIAAGVNTKAETTADPLTDDVQLIKVGTVGLLPTDLVVGPGPNGIVDTIPVPDDVVLNKYTIIDANDSDIGSISVGVSIGVGGYDDNAARMNITAVDATFGDTDGLFPRLNGPDPGLPFLPGDIIANFLPVTWAVSADGDIGFDVIRGNVTPLLFAGSNGTNDFVFVGDDVLLTAASSTPFGNVILGPGPNGKIDSTLTPGGDDYIGFIPNRVGGPSGYIIESGADIIEAPNPGGDDDSTLAAGNGAITAGQNGVLQTSSATGVYIPNPIGIGIFATGNVQGSILTHDVIDETDVTVLAALPSTETPTADLTSIATQDSILDNTGIVPADTVIDVGIAPVQTADIGFNIQSLTTLVPQGRIFDDIIAGIAERKSGFLSRPPWRIHGARRWVNRHQYISN